MQLPPGAQPALRGESLGCAGLRFARTKGGCKGEQCLVIGLLLFLQVQGFRASEHPETLK
jgi:hypothetical protein